MTSMPLVSVIITCFNIRDYISDAIRSVQAQSYDNLEILVVDDGSTDGTHDVLASCLLLDNIRYLKKENGGPSSARNLGITEAKGDFVAFLDGDDIWEPDKLKLQVDALLNNPSAGMIFSDFTTFYNSGSFVTSKNKSMFNGLEPVKYEYLFSRNNFIYPTTVIVKKKCFEVCGVFDEALRGPEDWDMWLRIVHHFEIIGIAAPLARIRQHLSNISMNVPAMLENERRAIDKQRSYISKLDYSKRVARLYLLNADRSVHNGNRSQAFLLVQKGLSYYPFLFLPICIVLIKVVFGGKLTETLRRGIDKKKYFRKLFEIIYKRY
ncbi:MAG: glycosyltransferase family 2 protein [Desulfuromonadales bacterium]|nr:glycosyltransferase family 2 protein [Desulfuromonadales bacterium]